MVVVDSESLEVLFDSQNLISAKNVLMSAHHLSGAGGPPFDPLGLFRFKIVLFLKGYRSQRVLEGEAARAGEGKKHHTTSNTSHAERCSATQHSQPTP